MFLPGRNVSQEKAEKQKHYDRVEKLCFDSIPPELKKGLTIHVQEVQCGDPQCSPIDTTITFLYDSGGQGMTGLPMEAHEVTPEELEQAFPTEQVLAKWQAGEEADWPPPPELRFVVDTPVECRVGPDAWASGKVVQLWYREPQWPEGSVAPYKILLDDGRNIYAPADLDQIIRLRRT